MSLVVLTGPVRSGKSSAAEGLAASRESGGVVVAVAGWDGDEEMARRIAAHRAARPRAWRTVAAGAEPSWLGNVAPGEVLLLDCLSAIVGTIAWETAGEADVATAEAEAAATARCDALVEALTAREGDTIVVTNEAGWGLVPPSASGRLFRDLLGRANRMLADRADAAYLVVDGRCIDLKTFPREPAWPGTRGPDPDPDERGPR